MDEILEVLSNDARVSSAEIAKLTGKSKDSIQKTINKYEKNGTIVKYKTVINLDLLEGAQPQVRALIEVSVSPQKNVGFDHIAERIYSFPEVTSCYLLSGTYPLDLEARSFFFSKISLSLF